MKIQILGTFDSSTTKSNGQQNIRFKFPYSEIANYSKLLMLLNTPLKAIITNDEGDKIKLGDIFIDKINVGKEGEAKVTVLGQTSNVELEKLPSIIEKVVTLKIKTAEDIDNEG